MAAAQRKETGNMCGIAGAVGPGWTSAQLDAMRAAQHHRGPDASGLYLDPGHAAGLVHNRLSILDLSDAGRQPMSNAAGTLHLVFNGEIYNYLELRAELSGHLFRTGTDSEVLLAAYERWGDGCLDRLTGMFSFLLWDERRQRLFAARDRFGVKPLHYVELTGGGLLMASEIGALRAAGEVSEPDAAAWSTYFVSGLHDHGERTFWKGVRSLLPGHRLVWENGRWSTSCWYDLADRIGPDYDRRPAGEVEEEYRALMLETIRLRFRSDVPVGIAISGGLDSATLLGLVHAMEGGAGKVKTFTYVTGDARYDELPWVEKMLAMTGHPSVVCPLTADEVPELAASVQAHQDGPFGGLPTLAYARVFEEARREGVIVVLDGQGMDEQWAGYEYYERLLGGEAVNAPVQGPVQGSRQSPVRPGCLEAGFRAMAETLDPRRPFPDALRNRQYQDTRYTKIPRALRFNDRVSMRVACELREPFLDHRMFELAFRQPPERKIEAGQRKWMLRKLTRDLLPGDVVEAPKRPVQTPQREWLAGPLREWARESIETALGEFGGSWLDAAAVRAAWAEYQQGNSDNSFYVWQWVSLGLTVAQIRSGHTEAIH
ncbi:MAG: asparagine synthase (glutamine-hydrolyzing) [Bryobacteraceae bacterium]